ncbi:hypothetical protein HK101_003712, partial [Irineochytrium annulatum]
MFDFVITFPDDYPTSPPKVLALTTSNGRVRFNPNIYASGKVCLSILGTWRGEAGEQWSSAHGVLSVLISIQSLMSDKPYHNEPGFEVAQDEKVVEEYNQKIMHETLRVAICDRLEQYLGVGEVSTTSSGSRHFCTCRERNPFEDYCKRMFLLYYDIYQDVVDKEVQKGIKDGQAFVRNQFEGANNSMDGSFQYMSVRNRLEVIYKAVNEEMTAWARLSPQWIREDTTTASNLRSQFDQIRASKDFESSMTLDLEDNNPFIWIITIFGMLGTNYEGGMFQARMVFHNSFPDILPRVRFVVDVFHPNISKDGVPYYSVKRPEDLRQHLTALLDLLQQDPDSSPATHVNLRASS